MEDYWMRVLWMREGGKIIGNRKMACGLLR